MPQVDPEAGRGHHPDRRGDRREDPVGAGRDPPLFGAVTSASFADDRIPLRFEATGYVRLRPPATESTGRAPALVAIHGYGQPPEDLLRHAVSLVGPDVFVVAPEGPQAFYRRPAAPGGASAAGVGHGWIADVRREDAEARNDALLRAALEAAARVRPLDPRRTAFLGYSQGVGVAARFLRGHADRAAAFVGLAGGVPKAARAGLTALAALDVLWVTGSRDLSYTPAYQDEMVADLRAAGVRAEHRPLDADHGEVLPASAHLVRTWLAPRLAPGGFGGA